MTITEAARRPRKNDRIRAHIADLKDAILSKYPRARIEEAPVAESRWPAIWVYGDIESAWDVFDLLRDLRERFFKQELMDVHVVVAGPDRNGA